MAKIILPKQNLYIFITHLFTELQFKMSICNGVSEQKLKINRIFLSQNLRYKYYATRLICQPSLPVQGPYVFVCNIVAKNFGNYVACCHSLFPHSLHH